jgi:hypothetical protein
VDPNELAPDTQASVVAYKAPGLRSYRKRLRELRFKDPFKQQYVPKPGGADTLGDALATTIDTLGGTTTTTGDGGGGGGKTTTKTVVKVKEVSFQLSVAVGEVGALEPRHNVPLLSFLPGEQKPVVIFLGIADDAGTKALFLVSRDVAVVSGEGICASGLPPGCEILVMKAGQIEDFEYTPDGKIYALKVTGIKRVVTTS